jgi:DNA-binding NarL/FixJ family response regulator
VRGSWDNPELVLVDITLPGKSGLELIRRIRSFDRTIKLLVISMHDEAIYANRVLRAGGDGYIMKQESPDEMVNAMYDVLNGHIYVSDDVMTTMSSQRTTHMVSDPFETLSDTELEILEMLGGGKDNSEIAQRLELDIALVSSSCESLKTKLKLKNNNALIHYATCWAQTGSPVK